MHHRILQNVLVAAVAVSALAGTSVAPPADGGGLSAGHSAWHLRPVTP